MTQEERFAYIEQLTPYLTAHRSTLLTEEDLDVLKKVYQDIFSRPASGCCKSPYIESLHQWYLKNKPADVPTETQPAIIPVKETRKRKSK